MLFKTIFVKLLKNVKERLKKLQRYQLLNLHIQLGQGIS